MSRLAYLTEFIPAKQMDNEALYAVTMLKAALQWTLTFTVDEDLHSSVHEKNLIDFDDIFEISIPLQESSRSSEDVVSFNDDSYTKVLTPVKQETQFKIVRHSQQFSEELLLPSPSQVSGISPQRKSRITRAIDLDNVFAESSHLEHTSQDAVTLTPRDSPIVDSPRPTTSNISNTLPIARTPFE